MQITPEHLANARSHAEKDVEAATLALGRALGQIALLNELDALASMPEPPETEGASEEKSG